MSSSSPRLRRALRVGAMATAAGLAWLAWHPEVLLSHPRLPSLVASTTRPLAAGVTYRTATVLGTTWHVHDVGVDLSRARLVVATAPGGATLDALMPSDAVAAINGAFFEKDYTPHGWLVSGGKELHPHTEASPHHVFALSAQRVFIGRWESLTFAPELALQNFPLLVEHGAARIAKPDPGRGFPRTLACDTGDGVLHLIVILPEDQGPSLYDTARVAAFPASLGGLGCVDALNLDGGPSSGLQVRGGDVDVTHPPATPIGHALAVVPRVVGKGPAGP